MIMQITPKYMLLNVAFLLRDDSTSTNRKDLVQVKHNKLLLYPKILLARLLEIYNSFSIETAL